MRWIGIGLRSFCSFCRGRERIVGGVAARWVEAGIIVGRVPWEGEVRLWVGRDCVGSLGKLIFFFFCVRFAKMVLALGKGM